MSIGYYSKKPVVILAMQYDGTQRSADEIITWTEKSPTYAQMYMADVLRIKTLESGDGWHIVSSGDWVIRGVKGEHYPCKPDIFEQTYQEERGYPYDRPEHSTSDHSSALSSLQAKHDRLREAAIAAEELITAWINGPLFKNAGIEFHPGSPPALYALHKALADEVTDTALNLGADGK